MSDPGHARPSRKPGLDADWLTIWHSELNAIGCDRELAEHIVAMSGLWSATAATFAATDPASSRQRPAGMTDPAKPPPPSPGRPDIPGPNQRRGPRPLWLHLMLAAQPSSSIDWHELWRSSTPGLPDWPAALQGAWQSSAPRPDAALLAGIAAYRRHPSRREVTDPPVIWTEGGSRLLDYGGSGPPVLFVPSLVNRAYILDLGAGDQDGHSMLRHLAASGVHPLLLDWGWPDAAARAYTLTDYIAGRLERALARLGTPVTLAGYCMGGLIAAASAARRPDLVRRLVLLATPWDFWAEGGEQARRLGTMLPWMEPALALGTLPVDGIQALFTLADPHGVADKYRAFGAQDQSGARARMFVAVEDWLSDGVPLAAPVAREVIGGWYGANTPAQGRWLVAGAPVRPPQMPCFIAVPARDRIVPPGSAASLAAAMPHAHVIRPNAGHVGMVAGRTAQAELWDPLSAWLRMQAGDAHG